jgi:hypothetical protein
MEKSLSFSSRSRQRFHLTFFALAAFGVGLVGAGAQQSSTVLSVNGQPNSKMNQFVIIFRQGPRTLTEADMARRQEEVSAWARAQNAAGHKLEPRILAPDVLRPRADSTGIAANGWPITALLFLEATDLAEAAKVAESHPANHFGATVEVRPWASPLVPAISPTAR